MRCLNVTQMALDLLLWSCLVYNLCLFITRRPYRNQRSQRRRKSCTFTGTLRHLLGFRFWFITSKWTSQSRGRDPRWERSVFILATWAPHVTQQMEYLSSYHFSSCQSKKEHQRSSAASPTHRHVGFTSARPSDTLPGAAQRLGTCLSFLKANVSPPLDAVMC